MTTNPTPIKLVNRAERRAIAKAVKRAPIKVLNKAELFGLKAAVMSRQELANKYDEANLAVREIMLSLGLDPEKNYPLGENGEVYAPE